MLLIGALCIALPGAVAVLGGSAHAGVAFEDRKLPMKFSWVACQPNCRGWVSAVGSARKPFVEHATDDRSVACSRCWT